MPLFFRTTVSATKRRALRRQRSVARQRWHLHRTGQRILLPSGLKRVLRILSSHHSKDHRFIARIQAAMTSIPQSKESWKCMSCRRVNKFSADYCPKCSRPWQEVMDRSFVDPRNLQAQSPRGQRQQQRQPYVPEWSYAEPWGNRYWDDASARQRTNSPREEATIPTKGKAKELLLWMR